MRYLMGAVLVLAIGVGPAAADESRFKPIDTKKLVVQPSQVAAGLAAQTIDMAGKTAAGSVESNGFVKTFNNLFGFRKKTTIPTQMGPSALPAPGLFRSTGYGSNIKPVMPSSMPTRR